MGKILLFAVSIALLCGCAKDASPEQELAQEERIPTRSHLISMDSLQKLAVKLPDLFGESPQIRSGDRRMIGSIEPLSTLLPAATRSADGTDPAFHAHLHSHLPQRGGPGTEHHYRARNPSGKSGLTARFQTKIRARDHSVHGFLYRSAFTGSAGRP